MRGLRGLQCILENSVPVIERRLATSQCVGAGLNLNATGSSAAAFKFPHATTSPLRDVPRRPCRRILALACFCQCGRTTVTDPGGDDLPHAGRPGALMAMVSELTRRFGGATGARGSKLEVEANLKRAAP